MSRTTRKPKFLLDESLETNIKKELSWATRKVYEKIAVKKDSEQYRNEVAQAQAKYEKAYKEHTNKWVFDGCPDLFYPVPRRDYVSRYVYYEMPISYTRIEKESREEYAKRSRDGYWNQSNRNKYFKWLTKHTVRNAYKNLKNDWEKYENISYPDEHIGDSLAWSVW